MRRLAAAACLALVVAWGGARAHAQTDAEKPDIEKLIRQLGHDRWRVREAATDKLIQIGRPALAAVRKAILSDDPEVSTRAALIYKRIVGAWPGGLESFRKEVQLAFRAGDYGEMIQVAGKLTAGKSDDMADWLWLGHACQLGGKWKQAVAAYGNALEIMDVQLRPAQDVVARPAANAAERREVRARRQGLLRPRTVLAWRIAQMYTGELKDPKSAAAVLARALKLLRAAHAEGDHLRLKILRDLAAARHDSGDLPGALRTCAALQRACFESKHGPQGGFVDVARLAEAISRWPAGKPLPDVPAVFVLTPDRPKARLEPNDPATRKRSWYPSGNPDTPHWRYAFAPAPGVEFATLAFAVDIEQIKPRHSGHFGCYVMSAGQPPARRDLGGISWCGEKPTGRQVCRRKYDIPPGVKLVRINTGSWKGCFNVHSVEVAATFRPVTRDAPPIKRPNDVWIQSEALPAGGTFTCGDRRLKPQSAHRFQAGRYRVSYTVPGREKSFTANIVARPGRCPLFVNLDSPFRWVQTNLPQLHSYPVEPARLSIRRLGGGEYLAVWCARERMIVLARSRDLRRWTPPQPAPFDSMFQDIAPATFLDAGGALWVAFFSKRLTLQQHSTGGYRLFLTSTRDGRRWSPLKPVGIETVDGWPVGAPCLVRGPKGKCWVFWRKYAGSGGSPADVHELGRLQLEGDEFNSLHMRDQHVTLDEEGTFHMVFSSFGAGIYHSTSTDGRSWAAPTNLVAKKRGQQTSHPRLILAGGKRLLIYCRHGAAYLLAFPPPGKPAQPLDGVKITNHTLPLHSAGTVPIGDGEILVPAGEHSLWLLRAKLKDLARIGR